MYEIFTLIHSENFFFFAFLLKHCIRINQWLNFNLNSTGEVQVIIILLTFSYKI